jgi:hypothetical protein
MPSSTPERCYYALAYGLCSIGMDYGRQPGTRPHIVVYLFSIIFSPNKYSSTPIVNLYCTLFGPVCHLQVPSIYKDIYSVVPELSCSH